MVRLLYELCCLRDPAQSMGLGAGESIHVVPISRTTQQARRIVFGGIASKLNLAPWWRNRFKETLDYIEFPDKKITIVGGASSDASALGLNVYTALVDEGNFMGMVKASEAARSAGGKTHDRAQMICDALVRRIQGTYRHSAVKGMLFLISSKRATDDFTERRIREHIKQGTTEGVFVRDYATWHVRPGPFKNQKWYRCSVSSAEGRCRILEDDEKAPEDAVVFDFPHDFLSEFQRDPAGATRDIAGIATDTYAPFIADRNAIEKMCDEYRPQVFAVREWDMATGRIDINWEDTITTNARGESVPVCCSGVSRHVHIDLSKNFCATGFNLCHQAGMVEVVRKDSTGRKFVEEAPVYHIDGILRIIAGAANEIDHGEVRGLIYRLNEGGFNIRSVSMDHWMSVPNMQLLKKHGFRVAEISTVKKIDPFDCARSALYEGRIIAPSHPQLQDELRSLELDPKRPHHRPKIIVGPGHCFTGDTRVRLLDGRSPTFVELVEEYGDDTPFHVYTIRDGRISVGVARKPRITLRSADLVEVALDSGRTIRCTPNHRFMLRDGTYCEAQHLTKNNSLMPLHTNEWACTVGLLTQRIAKARQEGMEVPTTITAPNNHKVISVRVLSEREDVYDLTVDETHNFALDVGVFVHNSKDLADAWAGGIYYLTENYKGGIIFAPSSGDSISPMAGMKKHQWSNGEVLFADEEGYETWEDKKDGGDAWSQAWIV